MRKALDISTVFLDMARNENIQLSHLKLQKILYVANGLLIANTPDEKQLFDDAIYAWKFGPVVPAIYEEYKFFGAQPINENDELYLFFGSRAPKKSLVLSEEEVTTIKYTWRMLKDVSAVQLSNWSHREGSAWSKVFIPGVENIVIPKELIREEFLEFEAIEK